MLMSRIQKGPPTEVFKLYTPVSVNRMPASQHHDSSQQENIPSCSYFIILDWTSDSHSRDHC